MLAVVGASLGGLGAMRVLGKRGHRMPKTKPAAATMPTFPQGGRSAPGAGISIERGVSLRGIEGLSLAQSAKHGQNMVSLATTPWNASRWVGRFDVGEAPSSGHVGGRVGFLGGRGGGGLARRGGGGGAVRLAFGVCG